MTPRGHDRDAKILWNAKNIEIIASDPASITGLFLRFFFLIKERYKMSLPANLNYIPGKDLVFTGFSQEFHGR